MAASKMEHEMTVETMASHLHKVTFKEQLIICNAVRQRSEELKYAHLTPALLPFVPMTDVHLSLASKKASRPIAVILTKVGTEFQYKVRVWLVDRKVFGPNPQIGRRFNWLPSKAVNGKPIDKVVALKKFAHKYKRDATVYDVVVHPAYRQPVMAWLVDNLT
jgi:hypothetical protein